MMKGMDISKWQGAVDFAKVAASGIQFAILREGYRQAVDGKFFEYVNGCRANNIPVKGVYHFSYALNADQARNEAAFCIAQVEKAGLGKDTVIFYDFEYDTVKQAKEKGVNLGKNECVAFTKAFCEYVTSHGYKAGIYSNIDYHKNMYTDELISQYIYWLADYTGDPDYPCMFHQYTSKGSVDGIAGNVDLDYFYGDTAQPDSPKKSVDEVAQDVVNGKYGNGADRKAALEAAGYNYDEIQAKVNEILGVDTTPKKSVDEIAQEVINGAWGNGQDRKNRIEQAGYDYTAVQNKVNELCGTPKKSIDEIARAVIRGEYGNGADRKNRITAEGYDYAAVQARVNELASGKTSTPTKSVAEVAKEVLAGKWGNGTARKTALENAGYNYSEVQQKVNELCGQKSVTEVAKEVIQGKWGNGATRKSKLEQSGYNYSAVQAEVNRLLR